MSFILGIQQLFVWESLAKYTKEIFPILSQHTNNDEKWLKDKQQYVYTKQKQNITTGNTDNTYITKPGRTLGSRSCYVCGTFCFEEHWLFSVLFIKRSCSSSICCIQHYFDFTFSTALRNSSSFISNILKSKKLVTIACRL